MVAASPPPRPHQRLLDDVIGVGGGGEPGGIPLHRGQMRAHPGVEGVAGPRHRDLSCRLEGVLHDGCTPPRPRSA
jgi:hypothetical protein